LATYLKVAKGEQYLERPSKGGNRDIKAAPHVKKTRENKYRATTIPSSFGHRELITQNAMLRSTLDYRAMALPCYVCSPTLVLAW